MREKILIFLLIIGAFLMVNRAASAKDETRTAIFAGGCFWCMEHPFEKIDGVSEVVSGFTGGEEIDPSYELVSSGQTGHVEAVHVLPLIRPELPILNSSDVFWRQIDPTDQGGQFVDRGHQYTSAIFYLTGGAEEFGRGVQEESRRVG